MAIGFTYEIKRIVVRWVKIEIREGEGEKRDENERAKTLGPKWKWIWNV